MKIDEEVYENLEFVMQYHKEQQGCIFDTVAGLLGKCDHETLRLIRAYVCMLIDKDERGNSMKIFYTFGMNEKFPFEGGWVEIEADSTEQAHAVFREFYPDRTPGFLNCAGCYTEEQFRFTEMSISGNFGAFCHRRIKASTNPENGTLEIDVIAGDEKEATS